MRIQSVGHVIRETSREAQMHENYERHESYGVLKLSKQALQKGNLATVTSWLNRNQLSNPWRDLVHLNRVLISKTTIQVFVLFLWNGKKMESNVLFLDKF